MLGLHRHRAAVPPPPVVSPPVVSPPVVSPPGAAPPSELPRRLADIAEATEAELDAAILVLNAGTERVAAGERAIAARLTEANRAAGATTAQAATTRDAVAAMATAAMQLSAAGERIATQVTDSAANVARAVAESGAATTTLAAFERSAGDIGGIVQLIAGIAGQVKLLALNASIEAARAGAAGRGFNVVAAEVKQLAARAAAATSDIGARVAALQASARDGIGAITGLDRAIRGIAGANAAVASAVAEQQTVIGTLSAGLGTASEQVAAIAGEIERLAGGFAEIGALSGAVGRDVADGATRVAALRGSVVLAISRAIGSLAEDDPALPVALPARLTLAEGGAAEVTLLDLSVRGVVARFADGAAPPEGARGSLSLTTPEATLTIPATCRMVETTRAILRLDPTPEAAAALATLLGRIRAEDAAIAAQTVALAKEIGAVVEAEIAAGRIGLADVFDTAYRAVPGADPPQYLTRFTETADRVIRPILDRGLALDQRVIGVFLVDRNGYAPTHNSVCSQPQRPGEPLWNAINARNRWLFNDRAGLAAGRSTRPSLAQSYERDMGGGRRAIIKEVDAPIGVAGRPWGAIRVMLLP